MLQNANGLSERARMAENGANRVRALIVDDEELGRRMLRSLLSTDEDVQIVGEAASAIEARRRRKSGNGARQRRGLLQPNAWNHSSGAGTPASVSDAENRS